MKLVILKIYPASGRAPAVIDVLESMKTELAAVADCMDCTVAFETGEEGAIVYTEQWRSKEALDGHLRSHIFLRVLEAMEYSRNAPKINFFDVSDLGGLELVEMARSQ